MTQPAPRTSIGAQRSPETHAAILEAAAALLREKGYAGVSMEAVARRAGAGKPTLYRWWPNKAALLMEVYETEKTALLAERPAAATAEADFVGFLHSVLAFWRDTPAGQAFRSIIAEAQADPAALAALRDDFLPRAREASLAILERARATGEIAPGADPDLLLDLLFGFAWYRLLSHRLKADLAEVTAIVAGVFAAARPGGALAGA